MNAPDLPPRGIFNFTRWAEFYDRLYARRGKDYAKESAYLLGVVCECGMTDAHSVLDVACGTGSHLVHLRNHFDVEGVDSNPAMLAIARSRLPGVVLHQQDMTVLDLPRRFDLICCLFGSINYLVDEGDLASAISAMARHLNPGGLLLIEPALLPEGMKRPAVDIMRIDEADLRLTRRTSATIEGDSLVITFDFNIESPAGVEPFQEVHVIRLFERHSFENALEAAALNARFDPRGPAGNSLFIGERS